MKKLAAFISTILLAGCASSPQGLRLNDLQNADYLVQERILPLGFVQIQQALIKHQAACGSGPKFTVDSDHPGRAWVAQKSTPDAGWDKTLLMVLLQRPPKEGQFSVKTHVYSYYAISDKDIEQMYSAILRPADCPAAG